MKYSVFFSCLMVMILVSTVTACIRLNKSCDTRRPQDCCSKYCRCGVDGPRCINYGDSSDDVGPHPCKDIRCPYGQTCSLQEVQCFRAPCPPIASCK